MLLGRRRLDMVFMPGRYVFPGGRVDPADKQVAVEEDLRPRDLEKLMVAMKGTRSLARARALALAAVRETFEEAGLLIGTPLRRQPSRRRRRPGRTSSPPATGRRWPADVLCARHHAARPPAPLRHALLLRRRPRPSSTGSTIADGELSDLEWHSIAQARSPRAAQYHAGRAGGSGRAHRRRRIAHERLPVPFYHRRNGNFRRDLIGADVDLD